MTIHVTGKHVHIDETLHDKIVARVNSFVSEYLSDSTTTHVIVSKENAKENHFFRTDVSVHVSRSFTAHCRGEDHDAFRSACIAVERLEMVVKKHRNKIRDQKRHSHIDRETYSIQKYVLQHQEEDSASQENPLVIAEMNMLVSPLTVSEAVMRLELSENPFLIFKNAGTQALNIVYKRPDQNIGWIDPSKQVSS